MTLDRFLSEMAEDIERFRQYWVENHMEDPNGFPMEMSADNAGAWFEQFECFRELKRFENFREPE